MVSYGADALSQGRVVPKMDKSVTEYLSKWLLLFGGYLILYFSLVTGKALGIIWNGKFETKGTRFLHMRESENFSELRAWRGGKDSERRRESRPRGNG